ncbi:MAG: Gfo/Idh/MocA family oxidoreductase [Balneolales bacterium]
MSNKYDRRDFLKLSGFAGLGAGALSGCSIQADGNEPFPVTHHQDFNMHGYAAPALETVRVGMFGVGNRGSGSVQRLASIEGVEIKAICDLEADRVNAAIESIAATQSPDAYSGGEDEWKKVCERNDIDLIAIATPWHLHTPMAVYAMEHGKHAYTELPAAKTIEECWQLVETSERTRMHCVQMSSSCHSGIQAVLLNMVRQGVFGDLIHAEGAYIHDLLEDYNFTKTMYHDMWRLNENIDRNGNLYPQHGIVPIIQMMDINYGDKMDYMVSMSGNDFMMGDKARELAGEDEFWNPYVDRNYRGNMNTSIIHTHKGRTIMLQHDVSSPRPRPSLPMVSGTSGIYSSRRFASSHHGWFSGEEFEDLIAKYTPAINTKFRELVSQASRQRAGHSYARVNETDWRLIDCLRNGLPVEMDVYEAAVSSSMSPLSEWSVANRSNSVDVPDFTSGAWKTNKPGMDVALQNGGATTRLL